MCRWLAYSGDTLALSEIIFNTEHSLIDQSLSAHSGHKTTNGDGFGIGWYDKYAYPGLYRDTLPAWNDANLKDLCLHIHSPMFFAHVRAATGTAIQRTNCHPFRYGNWLFMHNGLIRNYNLVRRELAMQLDDSLYSEILGTTDSELMFYLALHFGLVDDIYGGIARMAGFVEKVGAQHGVEYPLQMTLGISDGNHLYAVRYSSEHSSRTLYHSKTISALRELLPPYEHPEIHALSDDAVMIVSEPVYDLQELWTEIPESTFLTIESGKPEYRVFEPIH